MLSSKCVVALLCRCVKLCWDSDIEKSMSSSSSRWEIFSLPHWLVRNKMEIFLKRYCLESHELPGETYVDK